MGWASGSSLMREIIESAKDYIENTNYRKRFYRSIINSFNKRDWDTQNECEGIDLVFDEVLKEMEI